MTHETELLFSLLRFSLKGEPTESGAVTDDTLKALYRLSRRHNVVHIVGDALYKNGLLPPDSPFAEKFEQQQLELLQRYAFQEQERSRITTALKAAGVPFILLKGAVLRQYYPDPYLRSSCDLDVLVHREDLERAEETLKTALGYTGNGKLTSHDVSLFSESGVHIELHYDLMEDSNQNDGAAILNRVWEHAAPVSEGSSCYEMTDAMFYFYHIAHMAKHIRSVGCSIRPFMDLWVLEHRVPHDPAARDALLKQGGLLTFATAARRLSEHWFSNAAAGEDTQRFAAFILRYGESETAVSIRRRDDTDKGRYLLKRVFPPYASLAFRYPVLQKHKWLLPVMWVRRWFVLLSPEKRRRMQLEWETNTTVSAEQANEVARLFDELDL